MRVAAAVRCCGFGSPDREEVTLGYGFFFFRSAGQLQVPDLRFRISPLGGTVGAITTVQEVKRTHKVPSSQRAVVAAPDERRLGSEDHKSGGFYNLTRSCCS